MSRAALGRVVRTAVARARERAGEGRPDDVLAEELLRAVRSAGRPVQGMTRSDVLDDLERANHALVQARDRARAELAELERQAAVQRRLIAETHAALVRIVGEGAESREEEARTEVGRVFARARRDAPTLDGATLDALRVQVEALVIEAARRERRELLDGLCAERDRQIDVLERRLAKLNRELERSEEAVRALAAREEVDAGIASVYRTVQGLADDAPGSARKRLVLEQLFRANVALRARGRSRADVAPLTQGAAG